MLFCPKSKKHLYWPTSASCCYQECTPSLMAIHCPPMLSYLSSRGWTFQSQKSAMIWVPFRTAITRWRSWLYNSPMRISRNGSSSVRARVLLRNGGEKFKLQLVNYRSFMRAKWKDMRITWPWSRRAKRKREEGNNSKIECCFKLQSQVERWNMWIAITVLSTIWWPTLLMFSSNLQKNNTCLLLSNKPPPWSKVNILLLTLQIFINLNDFLSTNNQSNLLHSWTRASAL